MVASGRARLPERRDYFDDTATAALGMHTNIANQLNFYRNGAASSSAARARFPADWTPHKKARAGPFLLRGRCPQDVAGIQTLVRRRW